MSDETTTARAGAVVTAIGAAVAGVTGHPLESVLGAAGFTALQPFFERGIGWIADVVKQGASRSGRPVEELITGLDSTPEQQELFIKALEAARSTSLAAKRRALGDALAKGVTSAEAAVGETQFVRVVETLDAAHIALLQIMGRGRDLDEMPRPAGTISAFHYETHDLAQLIPNYFGPVDRLLAVLAAQGLADVDDFESLRPITRVWSITLYGIEVLGRLSTTEED